MLMMIMMALMMLLFETLPELQTDKVVCSEVVIVDEKEGYDDDVDDVDAGRDKKRKPSSTS